MPLFTVAALAAGAIVRSPWLQASCPCSGRKTYSQARGLFSQPWWLSEVLWCIIYGLYIYIYYMNYIWIIWIIYIWIIYGLYGLYIYIYMHYIHMDYMDWIILLWIMIPREVIFLNVVDCYDVLLVYRKTIIFPSFSHHIMMYYKWIIYGLYMDFRSHVIVLHCHGVLSRVLAAWKVEVLDYIWIIYGLLLDYLWIRGTVFPPGRYIWIIWIIYGRYDDDISEWGTYETKTTYISGWWFQPLWKILVSWDYYSQYMEK